MVVIGLVSLRKLPLYCDVMLGFRWCVFLLITNLIWSRKVLRDSEINVKWLWSRLEPCFDGGFNILYCPNIVRFCAIVCSLYLKSCSRAVRGELF